MLLPMTILNINIYQILMTNSTLCVANIKIDVFHVVYNFPCSCTSLSKANGILALIQLMVIA